MDSVNNRFEIGISSETKLKDKNIFTFEFKNDSSNNCRIRIESCQVYDCDGYMYKSEGTDISATDFVIGNDSKYFSNTKRVNITVSKSFKSRIGCNMAFTVVDIDEKKRMNLCFQKRSSSKWTYVGEQYLKYIEVAEDDKSIVNDSEGIIEETEEPLVIRYASGSESDEKSTETDRNIAAESITEKDASSKNKEISSVEGEDNKSEDEKPKKESETASMMLQRIKEKLAALSINDPSSDIKTDDYQQEDEEEIAEDSTEEIDSKEIDSKEIDSKDADIETEDLEDTVNEQTDLNNNDEIIIDTENELTKESSSENNSETLLYGDNKEEIQDKEEIISQYSKKDSVELLKQKVKKDKYKMYLGMTLGALMERYDLENQRLESFLKIFEEDIPQKKAVQENQAAQVNAAENIVVAADGNTAENNTIYEDIDNEAVNSDDIDKNVDNIGVYIKNIDISSDESDKTEEKFVLKPEYVGPENLDEYLQSIIEYDTESAKQIGLALNDIKIDVERSGNSFEPYITAMASYTKETYVTVRCPVIKVLCYDMNGGIASMVMFKVSRLKEEQDTIKITLKKASLLQWKKICKLKIMTTL